MTLIAVTCAFSIAGFATPHLQGLLQMTPNWLATWQIWRPLTANLMHNFVLHLIVNLLGLLLVGPAVEAAFGSRLCFGIYLASGLVGWIAQSAITQGSGSGASPAILGVSAALIAVGYTCRNQSSGVRQIVRSSIVSVLFLAGGIAASGLGHIHVANYAHLCGFLTGLGISLLVPALRSRRAAQPTAPSNAGPAEHSGDSITRGGPPSVS